MKCVNCDNHAIYTVADAGVNPVDYCTQCLPKHLRDRATAGHFPLAFVSAEDTTTKKSSKKKTEDTVVEEVTEETTE
jgi:hypothetical protein